MEVIFLSSWSRGRHVSRVDSKATGRMVGGVSHKHGKYCKAAKQEAALNGTAGAQRAIVTAQTPKLSHLMVPYESEKKSKVQAIPPKKLSNPVTDLLRFASPIICKSVTCGDLQHHKAHLVQLRDPYKKPEAPSSLPRKPCLGSSSSEGTEKHSHLSKEQQHRRSNPDPRFPALVTSPGHFHQGMAPSLGIKLQPRPNPQLGVNQTHSHQPVLLPRRFF